MSDPTNDGFAIIPRAILRDSTLSNAAKMVYLSLSSRANGSMQCWPKLKTIAEDASVSLASVKRALVELRTRKIVSWTGTTRDDGSQSSNVYTLGTHDLSCPPAHSEPTPSSERAAPRLTVSHQEREPLERDSLKEVPADLESAIFDEAWEAWPKKAERKTAQRAYDKAVRANRGVNILAEIKRFGIAYRATTHVSYIPGLAPWLNGERWTDDLPVAHATAPRSKAKPDWMNQ